MIRHVIDTSEKNGDGEKWCWLCRELKHLKGECLAIIEGNAYVIYPASEQDVQRIIRSL